jgi:hypothetical protein
MSDTRFAISLLNSLLQQKQHKSKIRLKIEQVFMIQRIPLKQLLVRIFKLCHMKLHPLLLALT